MAAHFSELPSHFVVSANTHYALRRDTHYSLLTSRGATVRELGTRAVKLYNNTFFFFFLTKYQNDEFHSTLLFKFCNNLFVTFSGLLAIN